ARAGSSSQLAVRATARRRRAIEKSPRRYRRSPLASTATGIPIAKFAAKLAAGYTLDEIPNDITKKTPASFEPSIDYVVVKIPRFSFEKFPNTPQLLGFSMQSVGEAMAIGRTFNEALQKGLRSLEIDVSGLEPRNIALDRLPELLRTPTPERIFAIGDAFRAGMTVEQVNQLSSIDPWFLREIRHIVQMEMEIQSGGQALLPVLPRNEEGQARVPVLHWKRNGFSDRQIATLTDMSENDVRK